MQELHHKMKRFTTYSSQIGGARPLSCVTFAPNIAHTLNDNNTNNNDNNISDNVVKSYSNNRLLAVSDWSGTCSIFNSKDSKQVLKLHGHKQQCGWITWHPHYGSVYSYVHSFTYK